MNEPTRSGTLATNQEIARASQLFRALSHPDRLKLLCVLSDGEATNQKNLVEITGWPQSTVARHLAALRDSGLVEGERRGTEIWLRLSGNLGVDLMGTVCHWLHEPDSGTDAGFRSLRRRPVRRRVRAS